jgi:hypothetical protein
MTTHFALSIDTLYDSRKNRTNSTAPYNIHFSTLRHGASIAQIQSHGIKASAKYSCESALLIAWFWLDGARAVQFGCPQAESLLVPPFFVKCDDSWTIVPALESVPVVGAFPNAPQGT